MRTTTRVWAGVAALVALAAACSATAGSASGPGGAGGAGGDAGGGDGAGTTAAPATTFVPRHLTLAASGDILIHAPVQADAHANAHGQGYDFDPMFAQIKGVVSGADFAICHQETPISKDDTNLTVPKVLNFNAPHEIADALKHAGFDACDTASNHTWDRGVKGVDSTLDVLDAAGLGHSGSSRNQAEADNPPIYDVNGVKVGHLAFTYTLYNNFSPSSQVPPEAPWLKSMLWPAIGAQGVLDQAHKLKQRGADFVVVSIHWGDEYVTAPTKYQLDLAQQLLASPDVDLILGDHVHVVQPCQKINGKYVEYGMGNFLSNQSPTQDRTLTPSNQDGSLEEYTIDEVSPGKFATTKMVYYPTWVVIPGHTIVEATPQSQPASYARTVKAMGSLGPGACDATPAY
jgi:poly-gamma-glutamate synthesis protein (capsule biosynthesis protein)